MTEIREKLAEIERGLEGVTPGPWNTHLVDDTTVVSGIREICSTCPEAETERDDAYNVEYERMEADAAHIARLDPDTIRAWLTYTRELEARVASPAPVPVASEPYMWVIEHPNRGPDLHSPGEQGFTEFLDEPRPGAIALYASPQPTFNDGVEAAARIADEHTPAKHDGPLGAHVTAVTIAQAIRAALKEHRP